MLACIKFKNTIYNIKVLCELFIKIFYLNFDETPGIIFHVKANQYKTPELINFAHGYWQFVWTGNTVVISVPYPLGCLVGYDMEHSGYL